jgi:pilus assembly protein CpaF
LAQLLADPQVSDILINGPEEIWVDRRGRLTKTEIRFDDSQHLMRFLNRMLATQGKAIDHSSPIVDAKLEDGSRLHALMPPLCKNGPVVSIRRFVTQPYDLRDMVSEGFMSEAMLELLSIAVASGVNIIISGGAASGKTTLMNALSQYIPATERLVTIEESAELNLAHAHVVSLEVREANSEGEGAIGLPDLLKAALRMRADRIMIGEVRGAEVFDMLQAMNVGHDGSMATVHANSPEDAIRRLEALTLIHGSNFSTEFVQALNGSAVQLVVQLAPCNDGRRHVESIAQVAVENRTLQVSRLFCRHSGPQEGGEIRACYSGEPVALLPRAESCGLDTTRLQNLLFAENTHD